MALGELQSLAKNICWVFHGIRRLKLSNSINLANNGKSICPKDLPGYCTPGWREINYGPVLLLRFLASRLQLPQRQQQIALLFETLIFLLIFLGQISHHELSFIFPLQIHWG